MIPFKQFSLLSSCLAASCMIAPAVLANDAAAAEELRVIPWREVVIPGAENVSQVRAWVTDGDEHIAYSIGLDELVSAMANAPQYKGVSMRELWRRAFCEGFWGIRKNDDPQFPFWSERVKAPDFVIKAVQALPVDEPSDRYVPLVGGYTPYWRNLADFLGMEQYAGRIFFFPDTLKQAKENEGKIEADTLSLEHSVEYGSSRYCSYVNLTNAAGKELSINYLTYWGTPVEHEGEIWLVAQSHDCTQLYPTPEQNIELPLLLEIKEFRRQAEAYELTLNLMNQSAMTIEKPTEASRVILYFESEDGRSVAIDETEYGFMESGELKSGESMELTLNYEPSDERVITLENGEPHRVRAVLVPNVSPASPAYLRLASPAMEYVSGEEK